MRGILSASQALARAANSETDSVISPPAAEHPVDARLCSSGVPNMERYNVIRLRYRCRSCSQVTPMPPCICTQRCTIWPPSSPT